MRSPFRSRGVYDELLSQDTSIDNAHSGRGRSGSAGLVSGEVLDADGAQVLVVDGYGLSLRGMPVDRGLTVGVTRRVYVYPKGTPGLPAPGRHLFWVPQPAEPPAAMDGQAIGLDVRASNSSVGLTLGFRGTAVFAQVAAGDCFLPTAVHTESRRGHGFVTLWERKHARILCRQ